MNNCGEIISSETYEAIAIITDDVLAVLEDMDWMNLESDLKLMRLGAMSWIL